MAADDTALAAIEHRVRQRLLRALAGVVSHTTTALAAASRANPSASATELLSRPDVHQALTAELNRLATTSTAAIRAGYEAAAKLGNLNARAALQRLGHHATNTLPDGGDYLQAVLGDVTAAANAALLDTHDTVRPAIDGVSGSQATAARTLAVNAALRRVARRLYVRLSAAATSTIHRGFADAQDRAWRHYTTINPFVRLVKTWHVRGHNPCAACRALDGTTVGIDEQFDRSAGALERVLPVYRDLHRPPRHPNCRCRITYELAPQPTFALSPLR